MASEVRARVLAFLADFLELPQADLHDEFDVVNDFDWSRWDNEDYGLLFELFRERFELRDPRFHFGARYDGPTLLKPFAWLRWRLFRYPRVTFSRMTVGDLVGMAERREWDPSLEDTASS